MTIPEASSMGITPEVIEYQLSHYNEDRTPAFVGGNIFLIAIATLTVILRLISRKIKSDRARRTSWGIDDVFILVALVIAWGMFVAMMFCASYGVGKHVLRAGEANAFKFAKVLYVLEAIYPACTAATKVSLLLLYRRVFTTHNPYFKHALYATFAILVGWAISTFFGTIFQCTPVHVAWDRRGGSCIDMSTFLTTIAALNTIINSAVLVLPMPMVWSLQMAWQQKLAICAIFVLGCGDFVSSIIRTWLVATANVANIDVTWYMTDALLLSFVEPCLGVVCACLPVMRPLFTGVFGGFFSKVRSGLLRSKSLGSRDNNNKEKSDITSQSTSQFPSSVTQHSNASASWLKTEDE